MIRLLRYIANDFGTSFSQIIDSHYFHVRRLNIPTHFPASTYNLTTAADAVEVNRVCGLIQHPLQRARRVVQTATDLNPGFILRAGPHVIRSQEDDASLYDARRPGEDKGGSFIIGVHQDELASWHLSVADVELAEVGVHDFDGEVVLLAEHHHEGIRGCDVGGVVACVWSKQQQ